jgi:hypothetical protein
MAAWDKRGPGGRYLPKNAGEKVDQSRDLPAVALSGDPGDHIDTMSQLLRINKDAQALLRKAMKKGRTDPVLAVRAMSEIRSQLEFQLKVFSTLYDLQAHAEFQQACLIEIEAADPPTRDRIIKRLREWRARRSRLPS